MYFKIALNNLKKSFKDYGIYFLTLTFAVCIFYSFNSIGNQNAMKDISESTRSYMIMIKNGIYSVSILVSFILGGLILYANNFLVKRRKEELGIYMMLGMGKRRISQILVMETFLIGIISLLVGLGLGIILSQGLSVFAVKLLNLSIAQYGFSISLSAIVKTIIYFGIIFLIVMIFNVFVINKYKLIDLLIASRKNEEVKVRNPLISSTIFILGVLSLSAGYYLILKYGMEMQKFSQISVPVLLGVIGTLLFFFGIAGFILHVVKKYNKVYFRGLNIFVTKQISSKINTNFLSMSVISLMLFVAIVALSSGLGLKNSREKTLVETTPFDATVTAFNDGNAKNVSVERVLKEKNIIIPKDYTQVGYEVYDSKIKLSTLLGNEDFRGSVQLIKVSQYNKLMELEGKPTVKLTGNEALMTSDDNNTITLLNKYLASGKKMNINGVDYSFINRSVLNRTYMTTGIPANECTIIVPDDAVKGLDIEESLLNLNYKNDLKSGDKFVQDLRLKYGFEGGDYNNLSLYAYTKTEAYAKSNGIITIALFITIYLGIIFLLTSAAVLALQQLSEASDSIDRYKSLRKIGVSQKMINKSVFYQIFIYFGAPLVLAIVDSIVGVKFTNKFIVSSGKASILIPSMITFMLLMIIYASYFMATYLSYKNVIKEKDI